MRILVVEDNTDLANSIATSIRQMEHAVDTIGDGLHAESMLRTEPYDLVVLDLNLPGQDGLEVLKSLRNRGSDLPVLILTARAETASRVEGLDLGADDYLTKPFHLAELDARVRALLRRKQASANPVLTLGPLEFDTVSREARLNGEELSLTRRERGVLEVLISARKKVISKDKIAEHLFSFDDDVNVSAIELYIHRLRKKLDAPGIGIRTVRGLGYVLEVDE
ncbi:MAG: response regulator [Sedimenticola sp.]